VSMRTCTGCGRTCPGCDNDDDPHLCPACKESGGSPVKRVQAVTQTLIGLLTASVSEGQAVQATGLDRVTVRTFEDALKQLVAALQYDHQPWKQWCLRQVLIDLAGEKDEAALRHYLGYAAGEGPPVGVPPPQPKTPREERLEALLCDALNFVFQDMIQDGWQDLTQEDCDAEGEWAGKLFAAAKRELA